MRKAKPDKVGKVFLKTLIPVLSAAKPQSSVPLRPHEH